MNSSGAPNRTTCSSHVKALSAVAPSSLRGSSAILITKARRSGSREMSLDPAVGFKPAKAKRHARSPHWKPRCRVQTHLGIHLKSQGDLLYQRRVSLGISVRNSRDKLNIGCKFYSSRYLPPSTTPFSLRYDRAFLFASSMKLWFLKLE